MELQRETLQTLSTYETTAATSAQPLVSQQSITSLAYNKKVPDDDRPQITEKELNDEQRKILTDLVDFKQYPKLLVLKAFEDHVNSDNVNAYDIEEWCTEFEDMYVFEEPEEDESVSEIEPTSEGILC